jgi:hypothetical protein
MGIKVAAGRMPEARHERAAQDFDSKEGFQGDAVYFRKKPALWCNTACLGGLGQKKQSQTVGSVALCLRLTELKKQSQPWARDWLPVMSGPVNESSVTVRR